jgi:hypothetical protein
VIALLFTLSEVIINKEFIDEWILQLLDFLEECLSGWLGVFDHSVSLQRFLLSFEKMIESWGLIEVILLVNLLFRSVIPLVRFILDLIEKLGHKLFIRRLILSCFVYRI